MNFNRVSGVKLPGISKIIHHFLINNILSKARHQVISLSHTGKTPTSNECTEVQLKNLKNNGNSKLHVLVVNAFYIVIMIEIENMSIFIAVETIKK